MNEPVRRAAEKSTVEAISWELLSGTESILPAFRSLMRQSSIHGEDLSKVAMLLHSKSSFFCDSATGLVSIPRQVAQVFATTDESNRKAYDEIWAAAGLQEILDLKKQHPANLATKLDDIAIGYLGTRAGREALFSLIGIWTDLGEFEIAKVYADALLMAYPELMPLEKKKLHFLNGQVLSSAKKQRLKPDTSLAVKFLKLTLSEKSAERDLARRLLRLLPPDKLMTAFSIDNPALICAFVFGGEPLFAPTSMESTNGSETLAALDLLAHLRKLPRRLVPNSSAVDEIFRIAGSFALFKSPTNRSSRELINEHEEALTHLARLGAVGEKLISSLPNTERQYTRDALRVLERRDASGAKAMAEMISKTNDKRGILESFQRWGPRASEAIPILLELTDDPEYEFRRTAVRALGFVAPNDKRVLTKLNLFIQNHLSDPGTAGAALEALARTGPQSFKTAQAFLKNTDKNIQRGVNEVIRQQKPPFETIWPYFLHELSTQEVYSSSELRKTILSYVENADKIIGGLLPGYHRSLRDNEIELLVECNKYANSENQEKIADFLRIEYSISPSGRARILRRALLSVHPASVGLLLEEIKNDPKLNIDAFVNSVSGLNEPKKQLIELYSFILARPGQPNYSATSAITFLEPENKERFRSLFKRGGKRALVGAVEALDNRAIPLLPLIIELEENYGDTFRTFYGAFPIETLSELKKTWNGLEPGKLVSILANTTFSRKALPFFVEYLGHPSPVVPGEVALMISRSKIDGKPAAAFAVPQIVQVAKTAPTPGPALELLKSLGPDAEAALPELHEMLMKTYEPETKKMLQLIIDKISQEL